MGLTSEEIKIIAAGGKCHIVNDAGQYLAFGTDGKIQFVEDKSSAFVYDYIKDNVPGQIENVRQLYAAHWYAMSV